MALEVRPAHDPVREYGFLGVVVDTTISKVPYGPGGAKEASSIEKTATIPPEPASRTSCHLLQGVGACRRW